MDPIQISIPSTPNFNDTSVEQAQTNTEFAVKTEVALFNEKIKADYLTTFDNWAINVDAGRDPGTNPPQPPAAFVIRHFIDPTTINNPAGPIQWAYPSQTGGPVTPQPAVPKVNKVPVAWFHAGGGTILSVPIGDKTPVGATVTSPDGSVWEKKSNATPFGTATWYEKVA